MISNPSNQQVFINDHIAISTQTNIKRIAVVNRGETAMRFLKTSVLFEPEIQAVLLYTKSDEQSMMMRAFEHKICIGEDKWAYSSVEAVLKGIQTMNCWGAWLGWGFSSEDAHFASALESAGIVLLAPSPKALSQLGDKGQARALAKSLNLPLNEGSVIDFDQMSFDQAQTFCQAVGKQINYPLLLKAVDGGGGRGIILVESENQLETKLKDAIQNAQRNGFRPCFVLESYWLNARHIEVQILGDGQGEVIALGVRDCSVQRRRQKVIEEAFAFDISSDFLPTHIREKLEQSAITLGKSVHYRSAGTVEFLYHVQTGQISFLEVNPRLQVEHTITEEIFDLDLVACQINIALGLGLPKQSIPKGWAIEARIYAEDPDADFRPSPGKLIRFRTPNGAQIRLDTGFEEGDLISSDFDPLIAKLIVKGTNRAQCIKKLSWALAQTQIMILGGNSNLDYLRRLSSDSRYIEGKWEIYTELGRSTNDLQDRTIAMLAYAIDEFIRTGDLAEQSPQRHQIRVEDLSLQVYRTHSQSFIVMPEVNQDHSQNPQQNPQQNLNAKAKNHLKGFCIDYEVIDPIQSILKLQGQNHKIQRVLGDQRYLVNGKSYLIKGNQQNQVVAPSIGAVLTILKNVGQSVQKGDPLFMMEAMKVEVCIEAQQSGVLKGIYCKVGELLRAGQTMAWIDIERQETQDTSKQISWPDLDFKQDPSLWENLIHHAMIGWDFPISSLIKSMSLIDHLSQAFYLKCIHSFIDIALLFDRRPLLHHEDENGLAYATRPLLLMQTLEQRGESALPKIWQQRLLKALAHFQIDSLVASKELSLALMRLKRANEALAQLSQIAQFALQNLQQIDLNTLERFNALDSDKYWQLIELADEKRLGLLIHPNFVHQYKTSQIKSLWLDRLDRFEIEKINEQDQSSEKEHSSSEMAEIESYWITAKENPEDKRLFTYAEIHDLKRKPGRPLCIPEVERVFFKSIRLMQRILRTQDPTRKLQWNRLVLHIIPIVPIGIEVIKRYVQRLLPSVQRMGLEKIVIQAKFKDPLQANPPLMDISIFNLLNESPNFAIRPASSQSVTPRSRYESQVVAARRRGLTHPDEIVHLLEGLGPFPAGLFKAYEWFEQEGQLKPVVDRQAGEHQSAVLIGTIETELNKPKRKIKRALIISDPTKSMGALTEAECIRIIALLHLAKKEQIPVEWVATSGGAKIDWETGTENLDWCAKVLKEIIDFRKSGGEINIIVAGACVGAQSYWNAQATMMLQSKGVLVMTDRGSMVLTGKRALDFSGCVSAEDELDLGGYASIMGPNGQAQLHSTDLSKAYKLLYRFYDLTYCDPLSKQVPKVQTKDVYDRKISIFPYPQDLAHGFQAVGDLFSSRNLERKKPFSVRVVMQAIIDQDLPYLERWGATQGAETAVVWHCRLGGYATTLIGIDNQSYERLGHIEQGPNTWAGGTLYPQASKKIAKAIYASQDKNPVVILANLSGFDGSPESLRNLQLEYGAAIGEAVVDFKGSLIFVVLSRYHGGAYVVFSKSLNPNLTSLALEGSFASVIGGTPAAGVIFQREVQQLAKQLGSSESAYDTALKTIAKKFDQIHDVQRAKQVGSIDQVIAVDDLRPQLIDQLTKQYQN